MKIKINIPKKLEEQILKDLETEPKLFFEKLIETGKNVAKDKLIAIINQRNNSANHVAVNIDLDSFNKIRTLSRRHRIKNILAALIRISYRYKGTELAYGDSLFLEKDGWIREISVAGGRIDGLNHSAKRMVELKFFKGWKGALGQIVVYGSSFPNYQKEIWLLTTEEEFRNKKMIQTIESNCFRFGVLVRFVVI